MWLNDFIDDLLKKSHWALFLNSKDDVEKRAEIMGFTEKLKSEDVFEIIEQYRTERRSWEKRISLGSEGWKRYSILSLIFVDMSVFTGCLIGLICALIGSILGAVITVILEHVME